MGAIKQHLSLFGTSCRLYTSHNVIS